jgi:hypothetical protein
VSFLTFAESFCPIAAAGTINKNNIEQPILTKKCIYAKVSNNRPNDLRRIAEGKYPVNKAGNRNHDIMFIRQFNCITVR